MVSRSMGRSVEWEYRVEHGAEHGPGHEAASD